MKRTRQRKRTVSRGPVLPPHPYAEFHNELMRRLEKMTPEEIFMTSVKSGIHTRSGKLRKPYAPQPDDS